MRVFLAGGTGVIGRPLVARLLAEGHDVGVLARTDRSTRLAAGMGATPLRGNALEPDTLHDAVTTFHPDVVINQLTALPRNLLDLRQAQRRAKLTNRLRIEASTVLARAAVACGARRLIAQSISFAQRPGPGVRVESDPLYLDAPGPHRRTIAAVAALERATLDTQGLHGIVLRYGAFYGPSSYFAAGEAYPRMLHKRLLPVIGQGRGIWALLHVEDAVAATVTALTGPQGVYNICDDTPVSAAELLPWMAEAIDAPAPRRLPRALFTAGLATVLRYLIDEQPAVSSQAARQVLGWSPRHPDWRTELGSVLRGE